jgi:murein DD-endopeptidase MepM/ murein hydrolase activator NlpD
VYRILLAMIVSIIAISLPAAEPPQPTRTPLLRAVDLNVGGSQEIQLSDGKKATVKLLDLQETHDELTAAVRQARVKVEVNGQTITLTSATYHLPVTIAGVRIDCPITKGYLRNANSNVWGLEKDARLRLWPAGSPLVEPGTFIYPAKQRWFASMTQMANEPVYVDGGERPDAKKIYYHYGLDIGGAEGMVEVVAATAGLVVSSGLDVLPDYKGTPVAPRYDVVYLLDERGWYYRYSHLQIIDPAIKPGQRVTIGQKVGVLGKEGASGGWSHLHFDITSKQPSGRWGIQEGYAFLWEAYQRQYPTPLIAVARPHHFTWTGRKVVLDGTRSISTDSKIARYDWTFTDGNTAAGPTVERTYDKPGAYSEVLRVTDAKGRTSYDFAIVQVLAKEQPERLPLTIHAAYAPTFGIKADDPVTFKVRTFRTTDNSETWDFGDGSAQVTVQSDGNAKALAKDGYAITTHRYSKSGQYLVRVVGSDKSGAKAYAHLLVEVAGKK